MTCREKYSKNSVKIRTIFVSEMKIGNFLHSNFSCLYSSMAISKFILSVNFCSIDSVARFLNRKVLILDLKQFLISFSFEKHLSQVATVTATVNPQHYFYIWNRVPKVILLNKLQKFKEALFLYCELYIGQGQIQPVNLGGAISVIFGSQVL